MNQRGKTPDRQKKSAESMDVVFYVCFVLCGRGLCDGLIAHSQESYRVCVSNCVCSINFKTRRPRPDLGCNASKKKML